MDEFGSLLTDHLPAAQGQYFVARTATPGTGIKLTTDNVTGFDVTTPGIIIQVAKNKRRCYLRYIKLLVTGAGGGLSSLRADFLVDSVTRRTGGGTSITTIKSPSAPPVSLTADSTIWIGNVTASAATTTQQLLGFDVISTTIPVVNDQFTFNFGPIEHAIGQGTNNLAGTNARLVAFAHHPVIIPPGGSFLAVFWASGMSTSPSVEAEIGLFER